MAPVWVILCGGEVLTGWVSRAVLLDIDRIDRRGLPEGAALQLVIDQRHGVGQGEMLAVVDILVRVA